MFCPWSWTAGRGGRVAPAVGAHTKGLPLCMIACLLFMSWKSLRHIDALLWSVDYCLIAGGACCFTIVFWLPTSRQPTCFSQGRWKSLFLELKATVDRVHRFAENITKVTHTRHKSILRKHLQGSNGTKTTSIHPPATRICCHYFPGDSENAKESWIVGEAELNQEKVSHPHTGV